MGREFLECGRTGNRDLGETLPVERHARGLEAADELSVREAVLPRGGNRVVADVYLTDGATAADRTEVRQALEGTAGVKSVDYISKQKALAELGQKVNDVRKEYFKDNKPASTLIQISKFALDGMLIEIEAIVVTR